MVKKYKLDLNKITKYLIRQTWSDDQHKESESFNKLKSFDFWKFLHEAGMFDHDKLLEEYTVEDKQNAKERYLNAISAGIQGS